MQLECVCELTSIPIDLIYSDAANFFISFVGIENSEILMMMTAEKLANIEKITNVIK